MEKQEILGLSDPAKCCGCGACAVACPVGAITMVAKELGAYYPEVNMDKCISCGKCRKVCVFQNMEERTGRPVNTYAAANADRQMLKNSTSGGVFAALARSVLDKGGVVCGCSMELVDGRLTPMHICVEAQGDLYKLQGSKYVQSKTGQCYPEVKAHLENDKTVFFSGTPCQVAALKRYLQGVNTEKLFTADLVCHGTPGTELFREYIALLESSKKGQITAFSFRDKSRGWGYLAGYRYQKKNGKTKSVLMTPECASYYALFLASETCRTSCYSCPWANTARVGDITLGDYWGVETEHPEYLEENGGKLSAREGISMVLVNNDRGEEMISRFGEKLVLETSELERAVKWNKQLRSPSRYTAQRDALVSSYEKDGYRGVEKQFRKNVGLRYYVRLARSKAKEFKTKHGG